MSSLKIGKLLPSLVAIEARLDGVAELLLNE